VNATDACPRIFDVVAGEFPVAARIVATA